MTCRKVIGRFVLVSALVLAPVITACAGGPSGTQLNPTEDNMIGHYGRFGEIQSSLVMGDLDAAREAAHDLAGRPMPPTTTGWVEALKAAAHEVAGAATISEAAQASGDLVLACGSCHMEVGATPNVRFSTGAPAGDSRANHMARAMWALDQLMDGIVSGDNEYWLNGARVLAEDDTFGEVGTMALSAGGNQRGAVLGSVIESCADCHTK